MTRLVVVIVAAILAGATSVRASAPAYCSGPAPAFAQPVGGHGAGFAPQQTPHFVPFDRGCASSVPICQPTLPPCNNACRPCGCPLARCVCAGGGSVWLGTTWIEEVPVAVPVVVEVPVAPPATPADRAMIDLRAGRYVEAAAEFLRRHTARVREELEAAAAGEVVVPDRSALRLHALALAGARDLAQAASAFSQAYREDLLLEGDPLDGRRILGSRMELRRIVIDGVRYAHRLGTFEAWSAVGYLMQAQGRFELATTMFERAAAAN